MTWLIVFDVCLIVVYHFRVGSVTLVDSMVDLEAAFEESAYSGVGGTPFGIAMLEIGLQGQQSIRD
jgi:hypothetical protein